MGKSVCTDVSNGFFGTKKPQAMTAVFLRFKIV